MLSLSTILLIIHILQDFSTYETAYPSVILRIRVSENVKVHLAERFHTSDPIILTDSIFCRNLTWRLRWKGARPLLTVSLSQRWTYPCFTFGVGVMLTDFEAKLSMA